MSVSKKVLTELFQMAGVQVNGPNPWDPQVHDDRFFPHVVKLKNMGLGEAYMDGWWSCAQLDEFIHRILSAHLDEKLKQNWRLLLKMLPAHVFNLQKSRAFEVGEKHYDTGNDLFEIMLDKRLTYTCAYWKNTCNLDDAQEAKLDLVCRKIGLKPGQTVLDIGCGWGSFAKFAAEHYGVSMVGITVSKEQAALAKKLCEGLPVDIQLRSYSTLENQQFDHIISLGMFEHVGYKNYRTYFKVAHRLLKDEGLFLLHTIGNNHSVKATDPWIHQYIFPNSMLPSVKQIGEATEGLFVMEDWHNFGADYDKTLMAWHQNFVTGWDQIKANYSDTFYRMWEYFLLSCAGSFRARRNQLWQIVLSKYGVPGGYQSIR